MQIVLYSFQSCGGIFLCSKIFWSLFLSQTDPAVSQLIKQTKTKHFSFSLEEINMLAQDKFFTFYFISCFVKEKPVQFLSISPLVLRLFSLPLYHFLLLLILSVLVKFLNLNSPILILV